MTSTIQIDNNVPIPDGDEPVFFEDKPKPKGRAKKVVEIDPVLDALKILGLVAKKKGSSQATHIRVKDNFAVVSDEHLIITVGVPFPFDVDVLVSHHHMLEAKKRSGSEFAVTQLDEGGVAVVNGNLRMVIPCADPATWRYGEPDCTTYPANDRLRAALTECFPYSSDTVDRPSIQGVLLQAWTCVATDGATILEVRHGIDMPPNLRVPVAFCKILAKTKLEISAFGFSDRSFTVWFKQGGWIRTALFGGQYANYHQAFDIANDAEPIDIPEEFFTALKKILPFTTEDRVFFVDGKISSRKDGSEASSYTLKALPRLGFNAKLLLRAAPFMENVLVSVDPPKFTYSNDVARGAVMGLDISPPKRIAPAPTSSYVDGDGNTWEDDIPF